MTAAQVNAVRANWNTLLPRALKFTDVLYEEFFAAEPQLRMLFENSMEEQHVKLVGRSPAPWNVWTTRKR
jgi:hemoglobin-like flavoprotein